jgi:hypothetical protein
LVEIAIKALLVVILRRSRRICFFSPSEKQMLRGVYPEFDRRTQHEIHVIRSDRVFILADERKPFFSFRSNPLHVGGTKPRAAGGGNDVIRTMVLAHENF